jgi:undecaprenyl-diphosphatase
MIESPGPPGHHHLHLFQDHRWAVAGAALMYAAAAALFLTVAFDAGLEAIQPIDDWWLDRMLDIENGVLTTITKALDILGGAFVIWPIRVTVVTYLAVVRRWALFTTFVVITVIAEVSIGLFKALYDRPRPEDSLVETSGSAFPSGHATATAATAIALVIVLLPPGEHRRVWEVRAGLFAFAMALSRTYLRAHWLSDVAAGALLGAATAIGVAALVHIVRVRMHLAGDESTG